MQFSIFRYSWKWHAAEFIVVFPLHQFLRKSTTSLRYTYVAYHVILYSHLRLVLLSVLIPSRLPTRALNASILPPVFMKSKHKLLQTELSSQSTSVVQLAKVIPVFHTIWILIILFRRAHSWFMMGKHFNSLVIGYTNTVLG